MELHEELKLLSESPALSPEQRAAALTLYEAVRPPVPEPTENEE